MLLNEFLKEHRKIRGIAGNNRAAKINAAKQEATIAQQEKEIDAHQRRRNRESERTA